jgi:hypothetical protein
MKQLSDAFVGVLLVSLVTTVRARYLLASTSERKAKPTETSGVVAERIAVPAC